jgi:hypothetical protein
MTDALFRARHFADLEDLKNMVLFSTKLTRVVSVLGVNVGAKQREKSNANILRKIYSKQESTHANQLSFRLLQGQPSSPDSAEES